jgi:ubiquitin C-terminal hydrolase
VSATITCVGDSGLLGLDWCDVQGAQGEEVEEVRNPTAGPGIVACSGRFTPEMCADASGVDSGRKRSGSDDLGVARGTSAASAAASMGIPPMRAPGLAEGSASSSGADRRYAGLANQGATCYMNSLLQTLFMTPEFRSLIFQWRYRRAVDGPPDECVPLQLQKLFGVLQTTHQRSIPTKALTQSFGWSASDSFRQHDVQELARVLLDALDETVAGGRRQLDGAPESDGRETSDEASPDDGAVNSQLPLPSSWFSGQLEDYVRCDECGSKRSHTVAFQDLALDIRPFGSDKAYTSVGESLAAYCTPEVMDEGNKVDCEVCAKKTRSTKGIQVVGWPRLLVLQLKRFTIDMDSPTLERMKLHDRVAFPFAFDPATLASKAAPVTEPADSSASGSELADSSATVTEPADSSASGKADTTPSPPVGQYELYAVLVHSGSALGGHYFAHIKDLETRQWWTFNDSSVTRASEADVVAAYGGSSAGYGSHSSAYMVVYRMVGASDSGHALFPSTEQLPTKLREQIALAEVREKEEAELRAAEARLAKVLVWSPTTGGGKKEVGLDRETGTVRELLRRSLVAHGAAPEEGEAFDADVEGSVWRGVDMRLWRLRRFISTDNRMTDVFENEALTLKAANIFTASHTCIEGRADADSAWDAYDPLAIQFTVRLWGQEGVSRVIPVRRSWSLGSLRRRAAAALDIPPKALRLIRCDKRLDYVHRRDVAEAFELVKDSLALWQVGLATGREVYAEDLRDPEVQEAIRSVQDSARAVKAPSAAEQLGGVPRGALQMAGGASAPAPAPALAPARLPAGGKGGDGAEDDTDLPLSTVMLSGEGAVQIDPAASPSARQFLASVFVITIKHPREVGSASATEPLKVDSRSTQGALKQAVCAAMGLDGPEGLTFRRISATGPVLRSVSDTTMTMRELLIEDGDCVFVSKGEEEALDTRDVELVLWSPGYSLDWSWFPTPEVLTEEECLARIPKPTESVVVESAIGWAPAPLSDSERVTIEGDGPRWSLRRAAVGKVTSGIPEEALSDEEREVMLCPFGEVGEPVDVSSDPLESPFANTPLGSMPLTLGSKVADVLKEAGNRCRALGLLPEALQRQAEALREGRATGDDEDWHLHSLRLYSHKVVGGQSDTHEGKEAFEAHQVLRDRLTYVSAYAPLLVTVLPPSASGAQLKPTVLSAGSEVLLVKVRWFDRSRMRLLPPRVVAVLKKSPLMELALRLHRVTGIHPAHMQCYQFGLNPTLDSVRRYVWTDMTSRYRSFSASQDGDTIVVTTTPDCPLFPPREIPEDLMSQIVAKPAASHGSNASASSSTTSNATARSSTRPQEQGIRINTFARRRKEEGSSPATEEDATTTEEDVYGLSDGQWSRAQPRPAAVVTSDATSRTSGGKNVAAEAAVREQLRNAEAIKEAMEEGTEEVVEAALTVDEGGEVDVFDMLG